MTVMIEGIRVIAQIKEDVTVSFLKPVTFPIKRKPQNRTPMATSSLATSTKLNKKEKML